MRDLRAVRLFGVLSDTLENRRQEIMNLNAATNSARLYRNHVEV